VLGPQLSLVKDRERRGSIVSTAILLVIFPFPASTHREGKLMEGDDTNVHSLNFPRDADATAADKLVRQAPAIAKMRKALFDAYVAEGFTVDQAIKLVCM